eukprot:snap_masked-scaffold_34-processed-gene-1.34-mRNA-1 protein AED:1.00 eAED:1.00 QI:0/-1/0/0/-1/1/1/0/311
MNFPTRESLRKSTKTSSGLSSHSGCGCSDALSGYAVSKFPSVNSIRNIRDIFEHPVAWSEFNECLKEAYAEENSLFYEAVDKYEKLSVERQQQEGKNILETYVYDNSTTWVNLPSEIKEELENTDKFCKTTFSSAKDEIETLMENNFLEAFRAHLETLHEQSGRRTKLTPKERVACFLKKLHHENHERKKKFIEAQSKRRSRVLSKLEDITEQVLHKQDLEKDIKLHKLEESKFKIGKSKAWHKEKLLSRVDNMMEKVEEKTEKKKERILTRFLHQKHKIEERNKRSRSALDELESVDIQPTRTRGSFSLF